MSATLSEHAKRYVAAHDHYVYARSRYHDELLGGDHAEREWRRVAMLQAKEKLSAAWREWLDHKLRTE